ncbi:MAG: hypothetical protein GEU82_16035 [Luteitalea sp.]|nr:hypothetical protein [Luteitalea sp.]
MIRLVSTVAVLFIATGATAIGPDTLTAARAIPDAIAGRFREARGFQQSASGQYYVFDRRGHTVYGIDEAQTSVWPIVQIGAEPGRVIEPTAFAVAADGSFVVADAPGNRGRIQVFSPVGFRIGGFMLPGAARPRITFENVVLNGIGSLQYTGSSILMSQPETGALVTEYDLSGQTSRAFGALRSTGHESDRDVHLALNSGIPLVTPSGEFYFVFQAGAPAFQKLDAQGRLQFERRMQGREVDQVLAALPGSWPRQSANGELPLVAPTIRAAAVDRDGHLWVSFVAPFTYVFDADGDRIRTVHFRGVGAVLPGSLFFTLRGRLLVTPGLYEFPTS